MSETPTTQTGIPKPFCADCQVRHPAGRSHCDHCGRASAFITEGACIQCRKTNILNGLAFAVDREAALLKLQAVATTPMIQALTELATVCGDPDTIRQLARNLNNPQTPTERPT